MGRSPFADVTIASDAFVAACLWKTVTRTPFIVAYAVQSRGT